MPTVSGRPFHDAHCVEYRWIADVEKLERYRPGGYHPIVIGDVFVDRYEVVHKLGFGSYSTLWLARDRQTTAFVAVKVCTADAPPCEAEILRALAISSGVDLPGRAIIPTVQDQFQLHGPNGYHRCYVISLAQSSVAAAQYSDFFPIESARALVAQLILAVAYTHARGFVHGDIHLGNALIRLPSSFDELSVEQIYERFDKPHTEPVIRVDGKPITSNVPSRATVPVWLGKDANLIPPTEAFLLLSDFGEAFSPASEKRQARECHAPLPALPPEALVDPENTFSYPSDIWMLACAAWSIFGLRPLLDGTLATRDYITSQQIQILGLASFPVQWWNKWEARHKYFDETGQLAKGHSDLPTLESLFEQEIQAPRWADGMGKFSQEEAVAILAMLRKMLMFQPAERATSKWLTQSEWMMKWGLPELEKAQIT